MYLLALKVSRVRQFAIVSSFGEGIHPFSESLSFAASDYRRHNALHTHGPMVPWYMPQEQASTTRPIGLETTTTCMQASIGVGTQKKSPRTQYA